MQQAGWIDTAAAAIMPNLSHVSYKTLIIAPNLLLHYMKSLQFIV